MAAYATQYADDDDGDASIVSSALYLCDNAYGGPEEGGWWYPTCQLVDLDEARQMLPAHWQPQFSVQFGLQMPPKEFLAHIEEANLILDHTVNMDRREIDSVLSEGIYQVCWFYGMPHSRPINKPRYE